MRKKGVEAAGYSRRETQQPSTVGMHGDQAVREAAGSESRLPSPAVTGP
jgi:hypothetical protein